MKPRRWFGTAFRVSATTGVSLSSPTPLYALSAAGFLLILRTNKYWPLSYAAGIVIAPYLAHGAVDAAIPLPIAIALGIAESVGILRQVQRSNGMGLIISAHQSFGEDFRDSIDVFLQPA